MYRNLAEYVARLEKEGELIRITTPVDPVLEIAEITDRVSKSPGGGKALLFENTGTGFPVLTNMFGSDRRMALALGVESLDDIGLRIDGLLKDALSPKGSLGQKMQMLPVLADVAKWFPKAVKGRGECQQVVLTGEDAKLSLLPILKCWPHDGGRFVTLPLVNTVHPETEIRNVGMYRMQLMGEHHTGMHWHIHKTGARHYDAYKKAGLGRMPISVCIGGDPAYTYAATAPMPDGMDEYLLAGFLRQKPVRLVKSITNDIYVPGDCDFVIEGYVDSAEDKVIEGPFGDHTGFYSLKDLYPVFHVTAITHRRDAIYPATLVGIPPQEDAYIAKATEKIFLAPIRLALQPEIQDLYMPEAGVAHNLAIISLDTAYAGQTEKVANALWGSGQMMFNKYMVAAPVDCDIRDKATLARLMRGIDVHKDIISGHGILDVLDHATATPGYGGKILINLTEPREEKGLKLQEEYKLTPEVDSIDDTLVPEWRVLMLRAEPSAKPDVAKFIEKNKLSGVNLIAVFDNETEGLTPYELLWLGTANTDPRRDVTIEGEIMVADCRSKIYGEGMPPRFPNVVTMDEGTAALVDGKWDSYGIGLMIESPSLRYRKLLLSDKAEV